MTDSSAYTESSSTGEYSATDSFSCSNDKMSGTGEVADRNSALDKTEAAQQEYVWQHEYEAPGDKQRVEEFMSLAKSIGLTSDQLAKLNHWDNNEIDKAERMRSEALREYALNSEKQLKNEWGEKFELNLNNARNLYNKITERYPETAEFLETTRLGDSPEIIKIFAAIGEMISSDSMAGTAGVQGSADKGVAKGMLHFPSMHK